MNSPNPEVVTRAIVEILVSMNAERDDPNFQETPQRVAKAMSETWFSGYDLKVEDLMTVFPNDTNSNDLVIVKDLPIYSTCAHHFAPFFGKGAIAYIPDQLIAGLSKFHRVFDLFARRLQMQEQITQQVADTLMAQLSPKGCMVVYYDVEHTCMSSRGVRAHGATTTTSAVRGIFESDSALRSETLALMGVK